jgi:hypothetical protein
MLSLSAAQLNINKRWFRERDISVNLHDNLPTLKVIMLNREIFPPEADMTYESFFDKAKQ